MWDVTGNKCYKNIAGGATTAQICAKTVEMDGLNQIKGYSFTNNIKFNASLPENSGNFTLPL